MKQTLTQSYKTFLAKFVPTWDLQNLYRAKDFNHEEDEMVQIFVKTTSFCNEQLLLSLSVILKVYCKILVSLAQVQNLSILDLAMAKIEKVNIADT
jgi:hypothetical protein